MDVAVEPAPAPESPTERPTRRRLIAFGAAAAVALGGGGLLWTWTHPEVSFDHGYGIAGTRDVGETVWTTLADSERMESTPVTFTSLDPIFKSDGAAVTVEYLICDLDQAALEAEGVGGFGYGLSPRFVTRLCETTRRADGATFDLPSGPQQELLVGVTATQPGRTVIRAHRLSYQVGWQRGSSDVAVEIKLRASGDR